jgi:Rps23 Pro-64 3,4-dihydroxylase Tpa1-like proline 4-hydroxylase
MQQAGPVQRTGPVRGRAYSVAAMQRREIAERIAARLDEGKEGLRAEFNRPGRIRTVALDGLLDEALARQVYEVFPPVTEMMHRKTIREDKYVAAQMDRYDPLIEEVLFAFQQPAVVEVVGEITGLVDLIPDDRLYAGGISAMTTGQYLNPHIDNSHDGQMESYRVLNLLYYTTPDWLPGYGGHLQVWDRGMRHPARTLHSSFNRLVLMATSTKSWHGVSEITARPSAGDASIARLGVRTCVSNYYFSPRPVGPDGTVGDHDYYHVTTFRGFPGQPARNAALVADGIARAGVRKVFKRGVMATKHVYTRPEG